MTNLDPVTVRARETLLDALEALGTHRDSVVVVGAQAIYLQTDESLVRSSPFTKDADLCVLPAEVQPRPPLQACMEAAGFRRSDDDVGIWRRRVESGFPLGPTYDEVDLLVPESLVAGPGRRSVDLGGDHDRLAVRRTSGLTACTVDNSVRVISSLSIARPRVFEVRVAGTAALLVAKLHKLGDRVADASRTDRVRDKDAVDILRILRHEDASRLAGARAFAFRIVALLENPLTSPEARRAIDELRVLFGSPMAEGPARACRALDGVEDEGVVRASCVALATGLLGRIGADDR